MKRFVGIISWVMLACVLIASASIGDGAQAQQAGVLQNAGFEGGTYQPSGSMGLVLPASWEVGWLDNAYGPRRREGVVKSLKPECLVITRVPPYLDPLRIYEGQKSLTCFKQFGTLTYWMVQRVAVIPGHRYKLTAYATAWALDNRDKFDPHVSTGIGSGLYYAEEGTPGLNDDQVNWRLRVGIDPYGGKDPNGSAVVWGKGAHIYNEFHSLPSVTVMARADSIAVFGWGDNLWGLNNSNSYWDAFELSDMGSEDVPTATPTLALVTVTPTPGNYVVVVNLLPQDANEDEKAYVVHVTHSYRQTIMQSADDARRMVQPGLPGSKVVVWDACRWQGNIEAFLGVLVENRSITCPQ